MSGWQTPFELLCMAVDLITTATPFFSYLVWHDLPVNCQSTLLLLTNVSVRVVHPLPCVAARWPFVSEVDRLQLCLDVHFAWIDLMNSSDRQIQ